MRTLQRRGRGACSDRVRVGDCGFHIGDFGAYTAPGVVDSDRHLGFARFAVRRRRRWRCGSLPVALTSLLDLNGCGHGVEDPYLPPAAGTNVAVGTIHERTLQEEGRERENLKKEPPQKGATKDITSTKFAPRWLYTWCVQQKKYFVLRLQLCGWRSAAPIGQRALKRNILTRASAGMISLLKINFQKGSMKPLVSVELLAKEVVP